MTRKLSTIHHFSCSGGTLISKCLSCMPDTMLISEIHPYNIGPIKFNPFDPVHQLFSQGVVEKDEHLLGEIFKSRIDQTYNIAAQRDMNLLIRDHTHSDYLMTKSQDKIRHKSVLKLLSYFYQIKSVVTLRNPIDSYLSLLKNGWAGSVSGFDDYCFRFQTMLDDYRGARFYLYEDFCESPDSVLQDMCSHLNIKFSEDYKSKFYLKQLTGDSGRGKTITEIKPLSRREYTAEFMAEVKSSKYFSNIKKVFPSYDID